MSKTPSSRSDNRHASRIQRGLEERASWWDRLLDLPLLWAALAVVLCTWLLVPRVGSRLPDWAPGEVATFDVMIPRDMTLPDETATEAARAEARAQVLPVYDLEPRVSEDLVGGLSGLLASCRERLVDGELDGEWVGQVSALVLAEPMVGILRSSRCSEEIEASLVEAVTQVYRARVVDDLRAFEGRVEHGVAVRNLLTMVERILSRDDLNDVLDLRADVEAALRTQLLQHDAVARRWIKATVEFLEANLVPNLVYSRAETAARVQAAADQVVPRSQVLRRGQMLIRRGDTVTPAIAQTLRLVNAQRQEITVYSTVVGIGLLMTMMVIGWWRILRRFTGSSERYSRLSIIFLLMIVFTVVNRLGTFLATAVALSAPGPSLSTADAYLWALPHAAGAITVSMLLGVRPAVLFAVCQALLAGVLLGGDFGVVVYALTSGLVGALAGEHFKGRTVLTRMGAMVGLANLGVLMVVQLYLGLPGMPETVALAAVCAFAGGPISVGAAAFVLPALEGLFGITTDSRLLELSNQNLPLLKRLSLQAPGSYQHSLAVGNLAEAGAEAVGANGLLLRVCSYYHDIGKLVKPDYFVENQRGRNPHDGLSPSMSALVILSHVKEGLEIARGNKLPLSIRQAVATHHGTKLIRYFYNKAQEQQDPELGEVRESDYRYPGPKPHTKELGILLLADAAEAAARTLENPTPNKIRSMIDRIFGDALEDDQLDDCELTFSELDKVASAFLWVLANMYHHRIDYPGFDFNRRRDRRDSGAVQVGAKALTTNS